MPTQLIISTTFRLILISYPYSNYTFQLAKEAL